MTADEPPAPSVSGPALSSPALSSPALSGPAVPGPARPSLAFADIARPPRLALVGDRSLDVQAHARIPSIIDFVNASPGDPIEVYWLRSASVTQPGDVAGFDGVWVIPGSPYESMTGVLLAIEGTRTSGVPFLGTCGGFQHLLLEFARNVCGLGDVAHAEVDPHADAQLITLLDCSLLGEEAAVVVGPGTRAAEAMGAGPVTERYFCRFGLNVDYLQVLLTKGLVFSGTDEHGDPRIAELPGHPFFVGSLFQPELSSGATWAHPLIVAFAAAVREHASSSSRTVVVASGVPA
jgi:CTP synthase (UTP-ammonia lyase)